MDNLVFSNMLHRPARTIVSILGISLGVLLIFFTIGLTNGSLRERATRESNIGAEIMFRASGSIGVTGTETFRLPISLTQDLAKIEGIKAVVPLGQTSVPAKDSNTGSRIIDGINFNEYAPMAKLQIIEGRPLGENGDEAVIDTAHQEQKNLKLGDVIQLFDRDFKIVGTYEPAAGARVKIPLLTMQTQLGGEEKCTAILISVKEGFSKDQVAEKISQKFPENQIIFMSELEELYAAGFPLLNTFLDVVIGVASIISALVILLTMYTTVTERTRQIGVLKSLGMSNAGIAWVIVQEAMLISACGIVFGVLLSLALKLILSQTTTLQVQLEARVFILTFIVGILGAVIGALYPAIRAARMDAVEALSYE